MSSYLLAISDDYMSNVTLFEDGAAKFAIAEERLSRRKGEAGFPELAVQKALEVCGISEDDLDTVAVGNRTHFVYRLLHHQFHDYEHDFFNIMQKGYLFYHYFMYASESLARLIEKFNHSLLSRQTRFRPVLIDHHYAHAVSAYATAGFDEALAVTVDNIGDGYSAKTYECRDGRYEFLYGTSALASPGQFYGEITQLLGFNPLRHAGKTTGLAAYGDPEPGLPAMERLFGLTKDDTDFRFNHTIGRRPWRGDYAPLKELSREDLAAAAQQRLEDVVCRYVAAGLRRTGLRNVVLAGGVFANVKLNLRIKQLEEVDGIYVHPAMGDEGLSMGVGLAALAKQQRLAERPFENCYLGTEHDDDTIQHRLDVLGAPYERPADIAVRVAELLVQGHTVAWFQGRIEYGPRALGNRSVFYRPDDPEGALQLSRQLQRDDFMPLAPITMADHADRCYHGLRGARNAARFMTICFDATDWMKEVAPGAVHVDGTVRPQLLDQQDNPEVYRIVEEYYRRTGTPSIINTSFNLHEEPIVESPDDAVRGFERGKVDYLAIGSFLVRRRES